MYRLEIFDQNMDYVSVCFTENMTIELDYLAYTPFQVQVNSKEAKKGFYVHITEDDKALADCVISDVKPDDKLQVLSLRPLQAIFDVDVFYTPVSDAITWIADNLDAQFISNTDTLQLLPLNITATVGSSYPLMGYNFNKTINILSVICTAFTTYGVVTECSLDLVNKAINVNIFHQTATQVIECDLENIVEKEITLGDSYGSTNKYTVKKTLADGTDPNVSVTYYLHNDGTIDTTDSNRIVPVFFAVDTLEQTSTMTDADWLDAAETKAKEVLSPAEFDNEVIVTVHENDKIVRPKDIQLGTVTSLMIGGNEYSSILSGVRIEAGLYTLTFGNVRTELTKKLTMAKRNSGSVTINNAGGGDIADAVLGTDGYVKFSNGFGIAWTTVEKTSSSAGSMGVNYYYDFALTGHNLLPFTEVYYGSVSVDARYFWGIIELNYSSTSWGTVRFIRGASWSNYTATITVAIFGKWS